MFQFLVDVGVESSSHGGVGALRGIGAGAGLDQPGCAVEHLLHTNNFTSLHTGALLSYSTGKLVKHTANRIDLIRVLRFEVCQTFHQKGS